MDQRQRLLQCARDLYVDQGHTRFTMRNVAQQANTSPTAIYRHFNNKEDLLFQVMKEGYLTLCQYLMKGLEGSQPLSRFHRVGQAYLEFALAQPKYYQILFLSTMLRSDTDQLPSDLLQPASTAFQLVIDRAQECMDAGTIQAQSSREVAMTVWAHAHGLITLYLEKGLFGFTGTSLMDEERFRQLYTDSVSAIFRGLAGKDHYQTLNS